MRHTCCACFFSSAKPDPGRLCVIALRGGDASDADWRDPGRHVGLRPLITRMLSRVARAVIVAGLALFGFEVGANVLFWNETGKLYLADNHAPPTIVAHGITTKLHPYFGFMNVYSPAARAAAGLQPNNYEFPQVARYISGLRGCCDFPIRAEDNKDKFVIAIFGDSIVHGIGEAIQGEDPNSPLMRRLSALPAAAGKRVVLLNLGLGGHKQPQELMTLAYLLAGGSHFDLVLYFAAVVEPIASLANTQSGLAADFPTASMWLNMSLSLDQISDASPGALFGLFALRGAQATKAQIEACETATCLMVYRPLLKFEQWVGGQFLTGTPQDPRRLPHFVNFPAQGHPTGPDRYDDVVRQWAEACRLMAAMTRFQGGRYLQVILPTPWVHQGDPLPWQMDPQVPALYGPDAPLALRKMVAAGDELQNEGIPVLDATHLLDGFPLDDSKLYLDYSGHLGPLGMKILLDYTVNLLLRLNQF